MKTARKRRITPRGKSPTGIIGGRLRMREPRGGDVALAKVRAWRQKGSSR